ncbi:metal-dependent hydrolase [Pyrococcus abyssi]|uniref:Membrane-bound metal-dependent hydrolase n=1 Tax=Pyrococcus abyssi (strain GE5 / Orsay) TaxID=272844 RepID=Q9V2B4_PYRAB|nr:metal-dependent hydrolase [Pyrococcus abyssi]CAB49084.1 Hypothetical protein PAB0107 [Pyrococcus abyssi GE5]CCE69536.1 TPA: hypothetical protein PAB0107 [Pyrococcus abyssi GE5]
MDGYFNKATNIKIERHIWKRDRGDFLSLSSNPEISPLILLVIGSIFPDLDVFTFFSFESLALHGGEDIRKEHRSYLHSLLFLAPLVLVSLAFKSLFMFTIGAASHLFLDFFSGVIPFFYPLKRKGYGVKIILSIGTGFSIKAKIILRYPDPKIERKIEISKSIYLLLLTLILFLAKCCK